MNSVDAIVNNVLYDGYVLYPYRPLPGSGQPRAGTAGVCPQWYCADHPEQASAMQFQCLLEGTAATGISLSAEFLHLIDRRVQVIAPPVLQWPAERSITARDVEVVEVDGHNYCAWQEASEHRLPLPPIWIGEVFCSPLVVPFRFGARRETEPVRNSVGAIVATLTREQQALEGRIRVSCACVGTGVFKLTVQITNTTALPAPSVTALAAMASSLLSCHAVLKVTDGRFVSLSDPPERLRRAASECRNVGVWPVLVGESDPGDTLLVSPIALNEASRVQNDA